ncbi:uncharacterized protein EI90DRAFT_3011854 [Cantharellus anzutake]|uniref:uncharacterized protein n=1 Tax=Cantharellus anzutake TaxID=1750568 RepID=UPI0019071A28|nr:uncharacterized protein EI90DRAFT_3011854 [Cantharellus anzutake]KAF8341205.1 hypothetical protein EI90DRAFT_3011854 [Cantharellus anzutake]
MAGDAEQGVQIHHPHSEKEKQFRQQPKFRKYCDLATGYKLAMPNAPCRARLRKRGLGGFHHSKCTIKMKPLAAFWSTDPHKLSHALEYWPAEMNTQGNWRRRQYTRTRQPTSTWSRNREGCYSTDAINAGQWRDRDFLPRESRRSKEANAQAGQS